MSAETPGTSPSGEGPAFEIGDDDWTPTPHGEALAAYLATSSLFDGKEVLELGGGVANHTLLLLGHPLKRLVVTEITEERLETTRRNVEKHHGKDPRIEYVVADWLNTEGRFDAVVTNPPFARSGQRNRRYFIDALLLDAHRRLREGGHLVFVQSSMADFARTRAEFARNGYSCEVVHEQEGPFRGYYFEDETFMREIREVEDGFRLGEDGTHYERLQVFVGRLLPWKPPVFAH